MEGERALPEISQTVAKTAAKTAAVLAEIQDFVFPDWAKAAI